MKQPYDIADSDRDNKRIQSKESIIDLPKIKDEEDTDSSTISPEEAKLLDDIDLSSSTDDTDEIELRNEALDKTDKDGELLNEEDPGDEFSGSDLDIPGTEEDDEDEKIGEEDEENNIYSPAQK